MVEAMAKTRKLGGSLMVTIPREVVEAEGLMEDQLISIDVKKVKLSGFGIAKGTGPFTDEFKLKSHIID
ncbi:TPA: hypothetical protein HA253_03810 [Candidatus Woesearchaeota archaeon]|nr:hypothetical protein [Candidatus Woesearchaeota archaeon]